MNSTDVYTISTAVSSTRDLDLVNDRMATVLIPVVVVITIYMVIGLFGNPLLVYYYGCVVTPSPSYNFIVAMAIFDIIICCVSMPLEIIDLRYYYKFPSVAACKILRFVNYFASISSGFVLIAVAADRYRKVCKPFKRQITLRMSKIITGVACIFSVCVSWPSFVIYDIQNVNISLVPDLLGYDCTTTRKREYKTHIFVYNVLCFFLFTACITSLTVLYILIGRKLIMLKKLEFSMKSKKVKRVPYSTTTTEIHSEVHQDDDISKNKHITTTCMAEVTTKTNDNSRNHHENEVHGVKKAETLHGLKGKLRATIKKIDRLKILNHSDIYSDPETDVPTGSVAKHKKRKKKANKKTKHEHAINLKKYTLLMFSVTLGFVLSFLPYLGLMTWRTLAPKYEADLMSKSELVLYNIFLRSWLLSSVINPFIYGFFNYDFSQFIVSRFRKICCFWRVGEFHMKRMKESPSVI